MKLQLQSIAIELHITSDKIHMLGYEFRPSCDNFIKLQAVSNDVIRTQADYQ